MSKGMAHEVAKFAPAMSAPRVMGQPTMPGSVSPTFLCILIMRLTSTSLPPWTYIQSAPFSATPSQHVVLCVFRAVCTRHAGACPSRLPCRPTSPTTVQSCSISGPQNRQWADACGLPAGSQSNAAGVRRWLDQAFLVAPSHSAYERYAHERDYRRPYGRARLGRREAAGEEASHRVCTRRPYCDNNASCRIVHSSSAGSECDCHSRRPSTARG